LAVSLEEEVVLAGGSGQAPGEWAVAAGGDKKPRSGPAKMRKCCHGPRMSLERGAFEERSIIQGVECSGQRMYYFTKPLALPNTQQEVLISGKGSNVCIRRGNL